MGLEGGTQASSRSLRKHYASGEIVAAGTPEQIAAAKKSYTGEYLKPVLARGSKAKKGVQAAE